MNSQRLKFYSLLLWQVGIAGLVAVLLFLPANYFDEGETVCIWKKTLGVECPGCGLTRATQHFLHGEWEVALDYNPLVVVVVPILAVVWVVQLVALIRFFRAYRAARQKECRDSPPVPK